MNLLLIGISEAKPGKHIGDIGNKIQKLAAVSYTHLTLPTMDSV